MLFGLKLTPSIFISNLMLSEIWEEYFCKFVKVTKENLISAFDIKFKLEIPFDEFSDIISIMDLVQFSLKNPDLLTNQLIEPS